MVVRWGQCLVWAANCFRKFSEHFSYVLWPALFSSSSTSKHSTLSFISLCLLPTICSITWCNVLQTDLTAWTWTIKCLLLKYYVLRDHKLGGLGRRVNRKTLTWTERERASKTTETCQVRWKVLLWPQNTSQFSQGNQNFQCIFFVTLLFNLRLYK